MSRADLHADMMNAMVDVVLQRVDNCIKGLEPDTIATAPEHALGFVAGFKRAKNEIRDLLSDCT